MKLKSLVKVGGALHELQWNERIIQRIMLDMSGDKLAMASVQSCFWLFIDEWARAYGSTTIPKNDPALKMFVQTGFLLCNKPGGPDKLISGLSDFELIESLNVKDSSIALCQNAFIYAVARTYAKPIEKLYMRAKNAPGPRETQMLEIAMGLNQYKYGDITTAAQFSNAEYVAYVDKTHPLLSAFVRDHFLIHGLKHKQILAVIGYLTNPKLEREEQYAR